jgi:oxygen-independent coproporphyrinogen-3 oxidase
MGFSTRRLNSPLPMLRQDDAAGLYIHLPFCHSKCFYCDFASGVYAPEIISEYLTVLRHEIDCLEETLEKLGLPTSVISEKPFDSLYFGGGTPSLLDPEEIEKIMASLRRNICWSDKVEITLEANPESLTPEKISGYRNAGINRISLGVQAFEEETLNRLGRIHKASDTFRAVEAIRQAEVPQLNIDLMGALPGQSLQEWKENLRIACSLGPEHLSIYLLEIHPDTPYGRIYGKPPNRQNYLSDEQARLPDDETVERVYFEAVDYLSAQGYRQYEISNFARPGCESKHNQKYWRRKPVLAAGCGAWSFFDGTRWGNCRDVVEYIEAMHGKQDAIAEITTLSFREELEESIFLGLRMREGLSLPLFQRKYGIDLLEKGRDALVRLKEFGLVEVQADCLLLTVKGCLLSNEVFTALLMEEKIFEGVPTDRKALKSRG